MALAAPFAALAQEAARRPAASADPTISRDSAVVLLARAQLGRRYVWGGNSPEEGFDCSGFLKYLMRAFGVQLPRTANEQAQVGVEVPRDRSLLRPGDILTFGRGRRVTHVGVYIGNGRYIHASSRQRRIVEASMDRPSSLLRAWRGVRRMLTRPDSAEVMARQPDTTPARPRS
ncbi:MAG TPA: C40 family peptidase [Longimicrobiaceae bacterium]|nr:C40 family peptidase [Longimicrobiaceae bacterium]